MSTPEQGGPEADAGQYATPEEIEDLEAAAADQENVAGGTYIKYLKGES
jgi:hypothetical protein